MQPVVPEPNYASLERFWAQNPGAGTLHVYVVSAGSQAAVQGAAVQVTKRINGANYLFDEQYTDFYGHAGPFTLPAPEKAVSYLPVPATSPFTAYTVTAALEGELLAQKKDAAIFDGSASVLTLTTAQELLPVVA